MAIPFMPLTPVRTDPRNALLDFSDLNRSIAGFSAGTDKAYDHETNQLIGDSLAKDDWQGAQAAAAKRGDIQTSLAVRQARSQEETASIAREKAIAGKFAAVAQAFDAEPDDAKAQAMLTKLYERDPRIKKAIAENLPPELQGDPRAISRYWTAIHRGYIDPDEKALRKATTEGKLAEAEKDRALAAQARTKPTGIDKVGKDDSLVQTIDDPAAPGGKRTVKLYGQEQGAIDPSVTRNITGGLEYLNRLPDQYGGDSGSFGSAVGPLQGAEGGYTNPIPMVARALGNLYTIGANAIGVQGTQAWPNEVRRAIQGGTETLSAVIKPLIRKPGEGSWSDADQAKLNSIVGELTKANDLVSYRRELANVRQRINANFNTNLPPLPGEVGAKQGERLPPRVGTIEQGYRFKGGDPAQPGSWEKVQ